MCCQCIPPAPHFVALLCCPLHIIFWSQRNDTKEGSHMVCCTRGVFLMCVCSLNSKKPTVIGLKCHKEVSAEIGLEGFVTDFCTSLIANIINTSSLSFQKTAEMIFYLNLCVYGINHLKMTSSWNTSSSCLLKVVCICVKVDIAWERVKDLSTIDICP